MRTDSTISPSSRPVTGPSEGVPVIYIVDDDPNTAAFANLLRTRGVWAEWLYPTTVTEDHLRSATLLAVDEYFRLERPGPDAEEDWYLPDGIPLTLVPADGLALSSVLRSASKRPRVGRSRPLGITLRTGELDELAGDLPAAARQPMLASQFDLEWVAPKQTTTVPTIDQMVSLAHALHRYPSQLSLPGAQNAGIAWLQIPDTLWKALARSQVLACRPPARVVPDSEHGLAWLRWLAHRILAYPTFVASLEHVAVQLGVTVESLAALFVEHGDNAVGGVTGRISGPGGELVDRLGVARYSGPLAGLQPPRYWRAGVHDLAVELVGDFDADDTAMVGTALAERVPELVPTAEVFPVLTIDAQYRITGIVDRDVAVRLAPDGWPAYADPAWGEPGADEEESMADLVAPRMWS
ncbi:MAG: hypothetical protein WBG36_09860 [Ornithinimicrobium sp.]